MSVVIFSFMLLIYDVEQFYFLFLIYQAVKVYIFLKILTDLNFIYFNNSIWLWQLNLLWPLSVLKPSTSSLNIWLMGLWSMRLWWGGFPRLCSNQAPGLRIQTSHGFPPLRSWEHNTPVFYLVLHMISESF